MKAFAAEARGRKVKSNIAGQYIHPDWGSAAKGAPEN